MHGLDADNKLCCQLQTARPYQVILIDIVILCFVQNDIGNEFSE